MLKIIADCVFEDLFLGPLQIKLKNKAETLCLTCHDHFVRWSFSFLTKTDIFEISLKLEKSELLRQKKKVRDNVPQLFFYFLKINNHKAQWNSERNNYLILC